MSIFITGLLVGIVSLIPGISGGTIVFLRNDYENISKIIANAKENKSKIFALILGIIIGALLFARVAEFLFTKIPTETTFLFLGFLLFSTPPIIKQEKKYLKLPGMIIGSIIILAIFFLIPKSPQIITEYPKFTLSFLLLFTLAGSLDGFLTIIPGISGSMVMMLLGPYYLYKSLMANLSLANITFLIPLSLYFIGDMLGIFIGSKLSIFLLDKYRTHTMSIITGFIIMSMIIIIPFETLTSFNTIITSTMALIISYIIIELLNSQKKKV